MVIKMDKYPVGLFARTEFFRVIKSVFTKECICKIPNEALTGFTNADDTYTQILCFKVHKIADYMIKKYNIQKPNKTPEHKRKEI